MLADCWLVLDGCGDGVDAACSSERSEISVLVIPSKDIKEGEEMIKKG